MCATRMAAAERRAGLPGPVGHPAGWRWLARVGRLPGAAWAMERAYRLFLRARQRCSAGRIDSIDRPEPRSGTTLLRKHPMSSIALITGASGGIGPRWRTDCTARVSASPRSGAMRAASPASMPRRASSADTTRPRERAGRRGCRKRSVRPTLLGPLRWLHADRALAPHADGGLPRGDARQPRQLRCSCCRPGSPGCRAGRRRGVRIRSWRASAWPTTKRWGGGKSAASRPRTQRGGHLCVQGWRVNAVAPGNDRDAR